MSLLRESPIKYRSNSTNFNNHNSGIKFLNSTSSSFGINKINQPNTGTSSNFYTRRSFSLTRNTQGKLDTLHDDLRYLTSDIIQTRNTTKQASLYLKFMREDLLDRKLPQIQQDLKQQSLALKKQIGIVARSDKLRFDGVWKAVAQHQRNTRAMSNRLFQLKNYITRLQNSLGFYSGAQKHKY